MSLETLKACKKRGDRKCEGVCRCVRKKPKVPMIRGKLSTVERVDDDRN